jgi:DNA-binding Lrp family transcriptional regulator
MLLFLTFTSDVLLGTYRYACFFTVINIFSAIGITYLIKLAGKMQKYLKLLVVALMIVSVAISACGVDSFVGDRTNSLSSSSCSDTFDYLQKNNIKKITVAYVDAESPSVKKYQARISVLLRFKYYDQKDSFQPLINELAYAYHDDYYSQLAEQAVRDENSNVLVKTDGSIVFCTLTSTDKLTDECYLFLNDAYSKLTDLNTDGYSVIQMGFFTILIKQ